MNEVFKTITFYNIGIVGGILIILLVNLIGYGIWRLRHNRKIKHRKDKEKK